MTNQVNTLTNQDALIEDEFKDMYPYEDMSNWDMNLFKSGYLSATQASEIEINALKERVVELQADNLRLREALTQLTALKFSTASHIQKLDAVAKIANKALSATFTPDNLMAWLGE